MAERFRRILAVGERVFEAGSDGCEAYIVERGRVEIRRLGAAEGEGIAQLGPDDLFGEMALLVDDGVRSATAVAIEPTTLFVIPKDSFRQAMANADPLLRHLVRLSLERARGLLRGATDAASRLAQSDRSDRDSAWQRLQLEQDLLLALERNEFELHYQAIVDLKTGSTPQPIRGFEALLRWRRPEQGLVSPAVFIPAAEVGGQIIPIGHWIIDTACEAAVALSAASAQPVTVAVNLSVRQLDDPALFPRIAAALARTGLPAPQLKLEITESLLMSNFDDSCALLRRCRDIGVRLAIDDFGTGYSSLVYLHRLPVDTLKLDRSFLEDVLVNPAASTIVRSVARMARELGMTTVAEGVESAEQTAALAEIGIDHAQGYYFHRPIPLAAAISAIHQA